MSKKPLQKINIDQAKVGMHIVAMDISWIDSPFLTHSKKLKSLSEIEKLKRCGAKVITIDPNKGLELNQDKNDAQQKKPPQTKPEAVKDTPNTNELRQTKKKPQPSVTEELSVAKNLKDKLSKAVKNLHDDIAQHKPISSDAINPLIDQTLESLERNNQALMTLAHLSKRSQKIIDHTFSVFCISLNMAQFQKLTNQEKNELAQAALLHDTGWNNIPLNLMGKRTSYTKTEKKLIQKHSELGAKILSVSNIPESVIRIIREHHEREDGSGYPHGIKQAEIHPLAKLLAVADSYDERVHQLIDKPGMQPTNALRSLYKEAEQGVFNQGSVATLIALLGIYPVTSAVELSNGEKAIIHDVPMDKHLTPIVEVIYDSDGKPKSQPELVDLSNSKEKIEINKILDPKNHLDDPLQKLIIRE